MPEDKGWYERYDEYVRNRHTGGEGYFRWANQAEDKFSPLPVYDKMLVLDTLIGKGHKLGGGLFDAYSGSRAISLGDEIRYTCCPYMPPVPYVVAETVGCKSIFVWSYLGSAFEVRDSEGHFIEIGESFCLKPTPLKDCCSSNFLRPRYSVLCEPKGDKIVCTKAPNVISLDEHKKSKNTTFEVSKLLFDVPTRAYMLSATTLELGLGVWTHRNKALRQVRVPQT